MVVAQLLPCRICFFWSRAMSSTEPRDPRQELDAFGALCYHVGLARRLAGNGESIRKLAVFDDFTGELGEH